MSDADQTDLVLLDVAKALDRVSFQRHMLKLSYNGIRSKHMDQVISVIDDPERLS